MAFQLGDFVQLRPFVYHVTSKENLPGLRQTGIIRTTLNLVTAAERLDLARQRRKEYVIIDTPDGSIVLKDQKPLIENATELFEGWSFDDLIFYLNSFVYFWPGTDRGPINSGQRLLDHYEADAPAVLRISTPDLFNANRASVPVFSAFNSGATRYNKGKRAFRGPDLFTSADIFPRRASEVIELGYKVDVTLPKTTEVRSAMGWIGVF
jgi:hypothetical protein